MLWGAQCVTITDTSNSRLRGPAHTVAEGWGVLGLLLGGFGEKCSKFYKSYFPKTSAGLLRLVRLILCLQRTVFL